MLTRLSIYNYALIDKLTVDFDAGLNTITGETGAGKSIILGALALILGNRADFSALKEKDTKCVVEGIFEIKNYSLHPFFEINDLDYENTTIIRREITPSGKSRAFINDTPVNLKILLELGLQLIDIHSQHQNLELSNQKFQLNLVDTIANSSKLLNDYQNAYKEYRKLIKDLEDLKQRAENANADLDYFQFQFNQLDEAKLMPGEQVELESELEVLTHSEEIKSALNQARELLDNEKFSVVQNLKESQKTMEKIQNYISIAPELTDRLQSCLEEIKDIINEAEIQAENIEFNPERIEQLNDRLNLIYSLQQKHHVARIEELIELRNSFEEKISKVIGYSEEINEAERKLATSFKQLSVKADLLSNTRKSIFSKIEKAIIEDMMQLGMMKSKFTVQHQELSDFTLNGKDAVSFLFSANNDIQPAEISKIASGGEMSRLMLAIKNLLRKSKSLPTIVFDEIDSGVSGEIALKMGTIIKSFSSTTQIINITHLPQIAAKGNAHFVVYKYENEGKTYTSIKRLNDNERVEELAKMVGGENITESILKAARELFEN